MRTVVPPEASSLSSRPQDLKLSTPTKSKARFTCGPPTRSSTQLGDDAPAFVGRYGVLPNGNAPFDPQHEFVNKNLLYTALSIADIAKALKKTPIDVAESLLRVAQDPVRCARAAAAPAARRQGADGVERPDDRRVRARLARARRRRPRRGERGDLQPPAHLQSATAAASFIRDVMWNADSQRLLRRYRAGDAAIDGYAEDYAYLIFGVLELFQASGDPQWLAWARELQARQDELFWDATNGGWFSTTGDDPSVLVRMKEDYDGAEPSPTSVSAMNLLTLAHLTGEQRVCRSRRPTRSRPLAAGSRSRDARCRSWRRRCRPRSPEGSRS